ncbi:MAG: ornithine carbamoyltransferase [Nitrospirae bacterium]|nr:ornithine carbamoyltransferase [Nitrospirota bacterium]MBI3594849.1 ornithine carbamoyltransferase [Nitrospirota bacterium]
MKRDLLSLQDLSVEEIEILILRAMDLKEEIKKEILHQRLKGKTLGLLFEKASTRTRVSFEVAMAQLGGHSIFLSTYDIQLTRGETIRDTARVLSSYIDGLVIRTFAQDVVEEWARFSTIPIINGLTDLHHPCQILSDLMTLFEKRGNLKGLTLAYLGDGNNVANSLLEGTSKVGMNIKVASPKGYQPKESIVAEAKALAAKNGSRVEIMTDPKEAVRKADVIYTDVWVSMGQELEKKGFKEIFKPYQLNSEMLKLADPQALVMHCLPAHRGEEITDEVIESKSSVIFQQAENRLHIQKALLEMLLKKPGKSSSSRK